MLIAQGTSRLVYDLGNGFVKKVPKDEKGVWQNESEIRIYKDNKDCDLILPLEDYDENAAWVTQRKCNPLSKKTLFLFKEHTGVSWREFYMLIVSIKRAIIRHKKFNEALQTCYKGDNEFLKKFESYIVKNNIYFFEDFTNPANWGILDGKIYLIDYGMDSITSDKYHCVL